MRMMIDLGNHRGPIPIMSTPTSVDCGREMRFRRSLRSLVECMVPCCGFQPSSDPGSLTSHDDSTDGATSSSSTTTTTVTGTFFGYRKGRVSFCLQEDTRSLSPLLLLEFAVPTAYLAREMQHGLLRIALECDRGQQIKDIQRSSMNGNIYDHPYHYCSLFNVPVWSMYCNGRKVGFAIRRQMTESDVGVLKLMQSVSVGAGVLPPVLAPPNNKYSSSEDNNSNNNIGGDLMYLRASFERVIGSVDSESFHMINPVGSSGQELSVFLLRS